MNTAQTIYSQLMTMDANLMFGLGAKDFRAEKNGLTFRVNGAKFKGYITITLDYGRDLYNVQFWKLYASEMKVKKEIEGLFFDQLPDYLEENAW